MVADAAAPRLDFAPNYCDACVANHHQLHSCIPSGVANLGVPGEAVSRDTSGVVSSSISLRVK